MNMKNLGFEIVEILFVYFFVAFFFGILCLHKNQFLPFLFGQPHRIRIGQVVRFGEGKEAVNEAFHLPRHITEIDRR